jgi:anti-anti-sigma factor
LVDAPHALGPDGHACWVYDHAGELARLAESFFSEGLELGQRLMFVGGPETEAVIQDTEPTRSLLHDGLLAVAPFDAVYPGGRRMAVADQWALYSHAAAQALADGFTGLRVLAEVTSLAAGDDWTGLAAWEAYADRRMAGGNLSALCCFDRRVVSDQALAGIASVHPVADRRLQSLVPFRLYGEVDALALAGEVDAFSTPMLDQLLGLAVTDGDDVVLDLSGLQFVDHHGLRVIYEHVRRARAAGGDLTLRGESATFRRLTDLLGEAR